jgi:predicted SAM-dependent methyltransferase
MLHIGCGDIYFPGWVNIDLNSGKADLTYDIRNQLPYEENMVDFIYSEHVIEHFNREDGLRLLADFYRILKHNGVVRVATPDLDYIVFKYCFFWWKQDWIKKYGYEWIKTKAEMMNISFREWGHQYIYNNEELTRRLHETGFRNICRKKNNKSTYNELKNRETRNDSKLILEAVK